MHAIFPTCSAPWDIGRVYQSAAVRESALVLIATINGPMMRADRERGGRMVNATSLGDNGPVRDT
jgi:hypothetical protein